MLYHGEVKEVTFMIQYKEKIVDIQESRKNRFIVITQNDNKYLQYVIVKKDNKYLIDSKKRRFLDEDKWYVDYL